MCRSFNTAKLIVSALLASFSFIFLTGFSFFPTPSDKVINQFIEQNFRDSHVAIATEKKERGEPFEIKYPRGKYLTPGTIVYPVRITFLINREIDPKKGSPVKQLLKLTDDMDANKGVKHEEVWWFFKNPKPSLSPFAG